jgi:cell division protein FtsL
MHRTINWVLTLATLAAAFALYAIKYDTRRLEVRVQAQERALEKAESDVTVLIAERAHLSRPERLEPLARLQGLEPIAPGQYLRLDSGSDPTAATHPRLPPERGVPTPPLPISNLDGAQ